ncbi:hypothetical protein TNCV_3165811 [Trichonephila clavipes]|uniref:Uncharacterized protein n=1 Tax=Trichonephila clavipes TaxID=2585209 RepID=A0A8X6RHV3_TRICX|nr:hypothetical protein TNCV_3165811 [Trichonephila clavipes]
MPSPVQSIVMLTSPLQTGSTVLSGQWDTHNRRRTSNTTSRAICYIPVVLNDFQSRETTLRVNPTNAVLCLGLGTRLLTELVWDMSE